MLHLTGFFFLIKNRLTYPRVRSVYFRLSVVNYNMKHSSAVKWKRDLFVNFNAPSEVTVKLLAQD